MRRRFSNFPANFETGAGVGSDSRMVVDSPTECCAVEDSAYRPGSRIDLRQRWGGSGGICSDMGRTITDTDVHAFASISAAVQADFGVDELCMQSVSLDQVSSSLGGHDRRQAGSRMASCEGFRYREVVLTPRPTVWSTDTRSGSSSSRAGSLASISYSSLAIIDSTKVKFL